MPTATASISVEDAVNRRRGDLVELSHSIHAEPELAFAEHRSCAKTQSTGRRARVRDHRGARRLGHRVSRRLRQWPAGGRASAPSTTRCPDIGHACGHNIIAASAVGTALALAEVADELGLTVALIGTPAEEAGGGKALLLKAGAFDDIAATVMLHPGPLDIAAARSLALSEVAVGYTRPRVARRRRAVSGRQRRRRGHRRTGGDRPAASAAGARPDGARHRHRRWSGHATSFPARAEMQYTMRATDSDSLRELEDKMAGCFAAGAVATGCDARRSSETAPRLRRAGARPVAGRRVPRRDGAAGPHPGGRGRGGARCRWAAPTWATSRR